MSKISSTTWSVEPHTEAKHEILKKYLNAWLPIMTRWSGRILYVDGFAGPGEYAGGKDGSPVIALKAILEHRANIRSEVVMNFIESDKKRYESLETKINSFEIPSNIKIRCIHGKFDDTLTSIFKYIDEQKTRIAPAFVFIDPFGFTGIPMSLIKRIMANGSCEVMITFMFEEINRFISDEKLWSGLIDTFGTDEWKKIIDEKNPKNRIMFLHDLYKKQLEIEAGIKFVRSFKMINKTNKTDYFLFFGTNSILGLKKMKEAMWKVDTSGLFQFSDATYNPNQPVLFESGPDYYQLKKILLREFKGKTIGITELENFIITQTPFRETHYKRSILVPMEKSNPPEIKRKCDNCCSGKTCKVRKTVFHESCLIEFL